MKKSIFIWEQVVEKNPFKILLLERKSGEAIFLNMEEYGYWKEGKIEFFDDDTRTFLKEKGFLIEDDVDQLANRTKIRLMARDEGLRKNQLSFLIAPTLYCNARCNYCFEKGCHKSKMTREIESKTIEFITGLVKKNESQHLEIVWFGGEPLLEKEAILRMSKAFIGCIGKENYEASIITNGSLIDSDTIELFHLCHITSVQITFDGDEKVSDDVKQYLNPKEHNFRRVLQNIELLCSNGIFVSIFFNLTKKNIFDVKNAIKKIYIKLKEFSSLFTIDVRPVSSKSNEDYLLSKKDLETVIPEVYSELLELGMFDSNFFYNIIDNFFCKDCCSFCIRQNSKGFSIDSMGYIYKCEHFIGKQEYSIGNVFSGIDKEKEEMFYEFSARLPKQCYSCPLLPNCQGGCLAVRNTNIPTCLSNKILMKFAVQQIYEQLFNPLN